MKGWSHLLRWIYPGQLSEGILFPLPPGGRRAAHEADVLSTAHASSEVVAEAVGFDEVPQEEQEGGQMGPRVAQKEQFSNF